MVIGSRDAARAEMVAKEMRGDGVGVVGIDNRAAAAAADIVIVAVPWDGHAALLTELRPVLAGKIVIDCVNPVPRSPRTCQKYSRSAPSDLSTFTQPTLIANGDHDRMVPTILSEDLHRRIKGSELIIYPDSGHGGIFQYHEQFAPAAAAFLAGSLV